MLPRREIYFCEGGAPLAPAVVKKIFFGGIVIGLFSDYSYMETPKNIYGAFSWLTKVIHKIEAKFLDGGIALSMFTKQSAEKYMGIPIRVCYPYIEDERYEKLDLLRPNMKSNNIISIANMEPCKGMDILIEAFKIVKTEVPNAELHLLGRGYPLEWNNIDGVTLEGYVDDLVPHLNHASIYVQPSIVDCVPVATLESLIAGVPAIVTDNTGVQEIVRKLGRDFVVKASALDLAQAIIRYFSLPLSAKLSLSQTAKILSKEFNRKEMLEKFESEFSLLLKDIGLINKDD
jgi:glycosyltransferase involved in cell wall biosynthesis